MQYVSKSFFSKVVTGAVCAMALAELHKFSCVCENQKGHLCVSSTSLSFQSYADKIAIDWSEVRHIDVETKQLNGKMVPTIVIKVKNREQLIFHQFRDVSAAAMHLQSCFAKSSAGQGADGQAMDLVKTKGVRPRRNNDSVDTLSSEGNSSEVQPKVNNSDVALGAICVLCSASFVTLAWWLLSGDRERYLTPKHHDSLVVDEPILQGLLDMRYDPFLDVVSQIEKHLYVMIATMVAAAIYGAVKTVSV